MSTATPAVASKPVAPKLDATSPKEALLARIAELENRSKRRAEIVDGFRCTEKGGVSVYALGRFPVTLSYKQWENFFTRVDALKAFITKHHDLLVKNYNATREAK